jgi:hypothetical protein
MKRAPKKPPAESVSSDQFKSFHPPDCSADLQMLVKFEMISSCPDFDIVARPKSDLKALEAMVVPMKELS